MSQKRARIAPASASRGCITAAKVSGNSKPSDDHQKQSHKSKSKIPNSLRYDLENALVGLCDVWFEEIKPHLVRNNIKVHIHEAGSAGDRQQACGAPDCSHLDPGAAPDRRRPRTVNYAGCCSTQPTALKARSHRPPPPPPCRPVPSPESHHSSQNQINPRQKQKMVENWTQTSAVTHSKVNKIKTPDVMMPCCQTYVIDDAGCHKPGNRLSNIEQSKVPRSHTASSKVGQKIDVRLNNLPVRKQQKNRKSIPHISEFNQQDLKPRKLNSKQLNPVIQQHLQRTPSTSHPRRGKGELQSAVLFQDDLIDIIAEKYDKQVKVLFQSSSKEESSTWNLKSIPYIKRTPWR